MCIDILKRLHFLQNIFSNFLRDDNESLRVCLLKAFCIYLLVIRTLFLGSFAKLRIATISFLMSVCPSVRMEHFGSH
jgi:hypothetical protein